MELDLYQMMEDCESLFVSQNGYSDGTFMVRLIIGDGRAVKDH
jgi:hypothetical protein